MTQYDNTNSGALFKNDYKESEKQPDYSGPFTGPNGEELRIAAWLREKDGKKFMSVKVSEPFKKKGDAPKAEPDFDDQIPF